MAKEPSGNRTEKQIVGKIGEDYTCQYLKDRGYKIIDRNYLRKWGEIDIVAKNGKKIHFVEVKSVTREISGLNVPRVTGDGYRPEDNMHPWKLERLGRVIQSYLLDKDISDDVSWQLDVATVYLDMSKRISKIFLLEDIIL